MHKTFNTTPPRPSRHRSKCLLGLVAICLTSHVLAQIGPDEQNYTRAAITARLSQVDNGGLVGSEGAENRELQSRYGAMLEILRRTELSFVSLDYEHTHARFHEDSQPSESYWEGESRVQLGNAASFYEVEAFHSVRRVLDSPSASPLLLSSSQNRSIYGVSPMLRLHPGANALGLAYNYSEVRFGESDSNDSSRKGFDLIYTRFVSPIREISVRIGQREIDYDTSDVADYDTESISFETYAEHRRYDYQISLGFSKVTPVLTPHNTQNEMIGSLTLRSFLVGNIFNFFATRSISDSSQGGGNASFFSSDISYDGAIAERDQIVRTSAGLGWLYELLCNRCSMTLNVGVEDMDFVNFSRNNSRQNFFDMRLDYDFSRKIAGSLSFRATDTDIEESNNSVLSDTESQTVRLGIYYQVNKYFSLDMFHEREERSRPTEDDLIVNGTGIIATLNFD